MNPFIKELKELLIISKIAMEGKGPPDEFIQRLNNFYNVYQNSYDDADIMYVKLELVCNLTLVMKSVQKNDQKCMIINFLKNSLRTCVIDDIAFFIHIYNSVFYQIYRDQDGKLSEEIKLVVLECSVELIKRSTKRLFNLLYNENYGAKFSMGILVAVQIAKEEKSFKLRIAALDFLLYAMQYHQQNDKVLQAAVGELFMLYLPGVIGRLEDIILRDEIQPHMITVKAISCWGQLLCTVMRDLEDEEILSDEKQIRLWMDISKESKKENAKSFDVKDALQEKTRSKKWLQAAAQTLRPLIFKIPEARKHSHPKVRLELTLQISRLLDNCLTTLRTALNPMIEVLIGSSEDDDEVVRQSAELAIARFESRCHSKDGQTYINVIEENLINIVNKLPNVLHLQDDKAILGKLQSLCGILKILSNSGNLGHIISCSTNLTKLERVLVMSVTLMLYPELSTRNYSVWDHELNSTVWIKEWKRFRHYTDQNIVSKVAEICRLLGSCSEMETFLDYLLDRFVESNVCRNELLLLINEVVSGCHVMQDNIVKQFLEIYLNPENLYLPLEVDDDACKNLQECHTNIVTVTLLMEGLGKLSIVVGYRFQDYLLKTLYYVIEKMGCSYKVIKTAATCAAEEIATAVGLGGDVVRLIQSNIDYLTYHVTVKLRRNHPGVFDVVTVVMKNSPFEAMTNLEEIINNVLRNSSEKFESPHTIRYLRLFQTFVACVRRWMNKGHDSTSTMEASTRADRSAIDALMAFINEKEEEEERKRKEKENEDEETEAESEEKKEKDNEEDSPIEEKKNIPKHIELTVAISETALNYLPSKNFDKKLLVLEILNESVLILATWENELLPLVHKIWSPLVTSFEKTADPLLIHRSFDLLYSLSRTSKDFIRRRTLKNVLPMLRQFLLSASMQSKLKDSGSGYHFTQTFKLQKELLHKLGDLAIDLRLSGKELDLITECALPYLSSQQPQPLQENCRKLFMDLTEYDPYVVWYKIHPLSDTSHFSTNAKKIIERTIEQRMRIT